MLSSGLVSLLGHPLMAGMCKVAHDLETANTLDYRAYTTLMLQVCAACRQCFVVVFLLWSDKQLVGMQVLRDLRFPIARRMLALLCVLAALSPSAAECHGHT
jgi:hypothetical protein